MIADDLADLFAEAEAKGLWFYLHYQGIWFSPRQLRVEQESGRFRAGNFVLRDPQEFIAEAEEKFERAKSRLEQVKRTVADETARAGNIRQPSPDTGVW